MRKNDKSICLVSPFPPPYGGMAIQAQKMVSLLKESGFEVTVVKTNADLPPILRFLNKVKGVRTIVRTLVFLRALHESLDRASLVYFLTGFFNFFFWVTYPALLLMRVRGKKIVLSARGGDARRFFLKYGFLVGSILRRVDAITVPSGFLGDAFRETLHIESTVVPNIADLEQFKFRERFPVRPRLLVTRSLEKIYNVACVIRAFAKVRERFPESVLGIVGDGSQRTELKQMVTQLGLEGHITFYGVIEHARIQDIYDQYDIYVNASNVDNMPGVILEAYACGLPVVSTRAGGIPYIVEDGVTGLLVDLEDSDALAQRVIQLAEQPKLALSLANNAQNECQKYSWEYIKPVLLPLLNDVSKGS